MARIKIDMPANFIASIKIPIRITDINYGNHVGNDAFVALIHEARVQWLQQHGYTELNIEGIGLIMSDLAVEFKKESFYGDVVEIKIGIAEISKVSFEIGYQLFATRNDEQLLLANAKTRMVCYNYSTKKVVEIPKALKEILQA